MSGLEGLELGLELELLLGAGLESRFEPTSLLALAKLPPTTARSVSA